MYDRTIIRAFHKAGMPKRHIARQLGVSRGTVRRALDLNRPVHYQRHSILDELEQPVRNVLARYPNMSTTGIAYQVGYRGSLTHLGKLVNRVRKEVLDDASPQPPSRLHRDDLERSR